MTVFKYVPIFMIFIGDLPPFFWCVEGGSGKRLEFVSQKVGNLHVGCAAKTIHLGRLIM